MKKYGNSNSCGLTLLLTWITAETQSYVPVRGILKVVWLDFTTGCANNAEKEGLSSNAGKGNC